MRKRSKLARFADRVSRKTGCNFFIDIIYNPGRHSKSVHLFFAQPRIQRVCSDGRVENIRFEWVDECDWRDEQGGIYGRGTSANAALADLFSWMADTKITVRVRERTYNFRVPKTLTA